VARSRIRYFFGFTSPFVAIADFRIDAILGPLNVELEPIPLVPQWPDPPSGAQGQLYQWKLEYNLVDATRSAKAMDMPWKPPTTSFFADTTDAVAGWYFARSESRERAYRHEVLQARWGQGLDLSDQQVLAGAAERAGLERGSFVSALRDRTHHGSVPHGLELAARHHVFGVPFFVVDGERFWGNDRLDAVAAFLSKPRR
jgi:2-hydroxychromene-2-carboxylate isomerase